MGGRWTRRPGTWAPKSGCPGLGSRRLLPGWEALSKLLTLAGPCLLSHETRIRVIGRFQSPAQQEEAPAPRAHSENPPESVCMPYFILYGKAKFFCYFRYFLTSYFCIPVPYHEKVIFFGVLVLESLVGLHRAIQLQLLQRYWLGHRLGLL